MAEDRSSIHFLVPRPQPRVRRNVRRFARRGGRMRLLRCEIRPITPDEVARFLYTLPETGPFDVTFHFDPPTS